MEKQVINVGGMKCQHCENSVKTKLAAMNGVSDVAVSLPDGTVSVAFDEDTVNIAAIKEAIDDLGFDVE